MKTKLLVLMCLVFLNSTIVLAQTPEINCKAKEATESFFKENPDALQEYLNFNEYTEQFIKSSNLSQLKAQTTYVIPVVFHVYGTTQNGATVDFDKIANSLNQVNEEFQGLNADYNTVDPNFLGIRSTMDITFKLAQIDPNGNATNGVVFHPVASGQGNYNSSVVAADGWDNYKYMNIYITADLYGDGVSNNSGVAWYPNTVMSDLDIARVVYNGQYLTGNTSNEFASVLTHEFGHWLNLIHTHEGGCSNGDQVADTPAENIGGNCNETFDCGNNINYENYMGYNGAAGCYKMFTIGQVDRMLAALNHPARQPLWQVDNLNATGVNDPGNTTACSTTISNFPYSESFENTLGAWSQGSGDDFDWALNSGGTPSDGTGPSAATAGTYYVYAETSNPNNPSKTTILNSPCFDLSGVGNPEATFQYQMTGTAVGSVRLEVREEGSDTWAEIWTKAGDQGTAWISESVDLSSHAGNTVQLRFIATSGTSWSGDIALDDFGLSNGIIPDTEAPSIPSNLVSTGVTETTIDLSWGAATDNTAVTAYEVFQGNTNLGELTTTSTQITGLTENTAYAFRVRAKDAAGNISGFSTTLNVTTEATTPPGGCVNGESTPYTESFEADFGLWTQASGDDIDWTRDSGGTPSDGTGPSTGSDGAFYVYVEASGNNVGFPNKRAILNSPCFDLSGETETSFVFDYHMFGATDGGRVDLEVSEDNGSSWTSIWNQTGNQGNQWNTVTIDLAAYLGGAVQLRFNRITGGTWQSDVALDNARLVAGGSTPTPPDNYCASNSDSANDEYISRVQIGSIDNSSGAGANGYQDFTSLSTTLNGSTTITITPQWRTTVYDEAYGVFVDWNRDGDFDDAGETVFTEAPTQATSITGTFNVPSGASQGPTRMRVTMKYNGLPTPCESFRFGEVEDYIVNVGSAAGPLGILQESASNFEMYPNPVSQQLHLKFTDSNKGSYTIYNLLGQRIHSGTYTEEVDVSRLHNGMYIMEIQMEGKVMRKRFVKN